MRKRISRKIWKLINEEIKILSTGFGHVRAFHCSRLEFADEKRTKKIRLVCSEPPFGKIGDENTPIVHDETRINFAPYLSENIAQRCSREELSHLVLNRGNSFSEKPFVKVGELIF